MVEKTEKLDFSSRQNRQKSGKNPAETAQKTGKMAAKHRRRASFKVSRAG
jgi:hypothetical protein